MRRPRIATAPDGYTCRRSSRVITYALRTSRSHSSAASSAITVPSGRWLGGGLFQVLAIPDRRLAIVLGGAQQGLLDPERGCPGKVGGPVLDIARHLVPSQPGRAPRDEFLRRNRRRRLAVGGQDERLHFLAAKVVGHADDRDFEHLRMRPRHVL